MSYHLSRRARYRLVSTVGEQRSRTSKKLCRIRSPADQCAESFRFGDWNKLAAFHRVVVATNLCVDSLTQSKSLVQQLGNIFRVRLIWRCVDAPNRFEK